MCAAISSLALKIVTVCQEDSLPRHECQAPKDGPDLHAYSYCHLTSSRKQFMRAAIESLKDFMCVIA